jgi:hypothetical protein
MVAALFGMRGQILRAMAVDDGRKGLVQALFIAGAVSGVGLFLIRFTSDAAWWTGHLQYSLN